ncbi:hypothetical protein V6N11_040469 [Hibiscus sabdariffa]|uniref:Uncharacterized protein n=1 Tax=Hibiscus sabdariffa TaxID=183260 RepID=A0ABR2RHZ5_9ROSI
MKNNEEQDEEQSKEYGMHKNGGGASLHVHKINGVMLPGDLQQEMFRLSGYEGSSSSSRVDRNIEESNKNKHGEKALDAYFLLWRL